MPQWLQLHLRLGLLFSVNLPHADYPIRGLIGQANLVSGSVVKGTVTTEIENFSIPITFLPTRM